jgi:hypothetical protein
MLSIVGVASGLLSSRRWYTWARAKISMAGDVPICGTCSNFVNLTMVQDFGLFSIYSYQEVDQNQRCTIIIAWSIFNHVPMFRCFFSIHPPDGKTSWAWKTWQVHKYRRGPQLPPLFFSCGTSEHISIFFITIRRKARVAAGFHKVIHSQNASFDENS